MWQILKAQIREEIYNSLITCEPYIAQQFLKENKRRQNMLLWRGLTKIRHMILSRKYCLKMYKFSDKVIKSDEETMKNWREEEEAWLKNLEQYISLRCAITISICDSDDATWSHT